MEQPCTHPQPPDLLEGLKQLQDAGLEPHEARRIAEGIIELCLDDHRGTGRSTRELEQALPGIHARANLLNLLDALYHGELPLKQDETRQHLTGLLQHEDRMIAMATAQVLAACVERGLDQVRRALPGLEPGRAALLIGFVAHVLAPEFEDTHPEER